MKDAEKDSEATYIDGQRDWGQIMNCRLRGNRRNYIVDEEETRPILKEKKTGNIARTNHTRVLDTFWAKHIITRWLTEIYLGLNIEKIGIKQEDKHEWARFWKIASYFKSFQGETGKKLQN